VAWIADLQLKLVTVGFISQDKCAIVDYVRNVDALFANKRCVELLDQARKLLMSNIHNIVEVKFTQLSAFALLISFHKLLFEFIFSIWSCKDSTDPL